MLFQIVHRSFELAAITLFTIILVAAVLQVVNRFVIGSSLSWSEELQRYGHIWLVFFAIPIGYRRGAHIGVDFLERALKGPAARAMAWVLDLGWLALGTVVTYSTLLLLGVASRQHSPGLGITMDKVYLGLAIGGAYAIFTAIDRMAQKIFGSAP